MKLLFVTILLSIFIAPVVRADPSQWQGEWPDTDFSITSIDYSEVISGGPPKDGIPAIDRPEFKNVKEIAGLDLKEPVISITHNGIAKAYPLRILIWHEIANDKIGEMPITVTYCPLCNASVVFDRRLDGRVLDFGVSGKLRHSDMIMYDRQTESWWQQFTGVGIVGKMTGKRLVKLPSQTIPFGKFKNLYPEGLVLVPSDYNARNYGRNPYVKYDSANNPFLYRGTYKGPVPAMAYVVIVEDKAWSLTALRKAGTIRHKDLTIIWHDGMNSALDASAITKGRDLGYVLVQKSLPDGSWEEIVYDMSFAFAFKAFYPNGIIYTE